MTGKLTPKRSIAKLALIGFFAAAGIASAATPTLSIAHASAGDVSDDYRPSAWATASEPGKAPSLNTKLETPESRHSSGLWLGYGLVGVGLLALGVGLTAAARMPRTAPDRTGGGASRLRRRATSATHAGH